VSRIVWKPPNQKVGPMKMNNKDKELYKRIDEVLHYIWDPIGVANEPYARNEYESYVPQIFSMVKSNKELQLISKRLAEIESDRMEFTPNIENCNKVVEILIAYKKKIFDESTS
jgi:hypothetical protein